MCACVGVPVMSVSVKCRCVGKSIRVYVYVQMPVCLYCTCVSRCGICLYACVYGV